MGLEKNAYRGRIDGKLQGLDLNAPLYLGTVANFFLLFCPFGLQYLNAKQGLFYGGFVLNSVEPIIYYTPLVLA